MKIKSLLSLGTVLLGYSLFCQVTTDPAVPNADQEITIIYDATKGTSGLAGASTVYMHSGVILDSENGSSWQNVVGNWGSDDGIGEMTPVEGETDKWEITINPRDYYNVPTAPIYRIGMVFRNADGSREGKSDSNSDIFIDLLQEGYGIILNSPLSSSFLVSQGETINIEVQASENSAFTLTIGGSQIETVTDIDTYEYAHQVTETEGKISVSIEATNGSDTDEVDFQYILRTSTPVVSIPDGIKKGINYHENDITMVTLCLEAPLKSSVYVIGDFNNWEIDPNYLMNKDGDLFWLEISELQPNQEYIFQYMVDENIFVADPYSEKISDPEDDQIGSSTYPDLPSYPIQAYRNKWYYQRASVIETNQASYEWEIENFTNPSKDALVIYELLIRDYFGSGNRNYQNLIDTLSYLSDLGVNAIELMPITEFNGNESWGYNNTFMFAPDKAYGSKDQLKKFIDEAHKVGIAVIVDIVMNHHDIPAPNAVMYFDGEITADNPWFNISPPHSVLGFFFDLNHESDYTKSYLDSVNHYWMTEFKIDGFRFDLSKGFTQKETSGYGDWGAYDASRIAILKRMADEIWAVNPDEYIILEHFADNTEEKELSDYGMMLWGNMTHAYGQLAMGYSSESNISGVSASQRGWGENNLIGYMESHDEERLMYKCLEFGNGNSSYSTTDYNTALERVMAVSSFFYTVPGPKMLWQFGETGFDYSINRCTNGSISENCRLSIKPTTWSYLENVENQNLFRVTQQLIALKTSYSIFQSSEVTFFGGSNLSRYFWLKQNDLDNPTNPNEMNAIVVGNFDIMQKNLDANFPHNGKWYHYFDQGDSLEVDGAQTLTLQPGEFRIYTDVRLDPTEPELYSNLKPLAPSELTVIDLEEGIQLNWTDNSSINSGYKIYRSSNDSEYTLIAEVSDVVSYLDENVRQGQEYNYYVSSFNQVGERSSESITITANNVLLSVAENRLVVFPNPANKSIHISDNFNFDFFEILNLAGQSVLQGSFKKTIDVSVLVEGLYFINLSSNSKTKTLKFIKE